MFFCRTNMQLFKRKKIEAETKCKYCGMDFSESERMLRHMIKAHSKINKTQPK